MHSRLDRSIGTSAKCTCDRHRYVPVEPPSERVTDADDLTESDEKILDVLHEGARTKGALIDETGLHRNTVGYRLDVLTASGIVDEIHDTTALYELSEDPREGHEVPDPARLREQLQECREQLQQARAEAEAVEDDPEVAEIKEGLQSAFTALSGQHPDVDMAKGELEAVVEGLEDE